MASVERIIPGAVASGVQRYPGERRLTLAVVPNANGNRAERRLHARGKRKSGQAQRG
jgi:hypothetical protein